MTAIIVKTATATGHVIAIEPGLVAVGGAGRGSGSESISDRKTGAFLALGFLSLIAAVLKTHWSVATAA